MEDLKVDLKTEILTWTKVGPYPQPGACEPLIKGNVHLGMMHSTPFWARMTGSHLQM